MAEDTSTNGIARILGRFTRLYPSVRVRTRTSQNLNVLAWLKASKLDVAAVQFFHHDVLPDDPILFEDT